MANQQYMELLRDPRWQRKRLEKLQQADWQCALCYSKEKTLNVHHKRYKRGAPPWDCELFDLEVLCEDCHEAVTNATRALRAIVDAGDLFTIFRLSGYAQAIWVKQNKSRDPIIAHTTNEVQGIVDAFAEGRTYGFEVTMGDLLNISGPIDVDAIAKRESQAMDESFERWAREAYLTREEK